jgi:hypothetical protein
VVAMKLFFLLISVAFAQPSPSPGPSSGGNLGKDTYAMSHPFAYKAFMEKYFPTAENVVQANSTSTCNEWVKLCIDDGHMTSCQGPQGNFQMHAVGAYKRDSGAKSMEQLEIEFTKAMGSMTKYDPYFEYHMAFLTTDLDSYISSFDSDKVQYFASTFQSSGKTYKSIIVQIPGSLAANAKSTINIEILGSSSSILEARAGLHHHDIPRASLDTIAAAHFTLGTAPRKLSANGKPVLAGVHRSFASSDVSRDAKYFESAMQGTGSTTGGVYEGKMQSGDTKAIRFVQTSAKTQGPTSVSAWEAYQVALHKKCFDTANNQGFDRLADNHMGHNLGGAAIDPYVKGQIASGQPYRFYAGPMGSMHFYYMYAPNGWGLQIIGSLTDSSLGPKAETGYGFCTQGITGRCSKDGSSDVVV